VTKVNRNGPPVETQPTKIKVQVILDRMTRCSLGTMNLTTYLIPLPSLSIICIPSRNKYIVSSRDIPSESPSETSITFVSEVYSPERDNQHTDWIVL
jgi:hypothetical protein